jgi:hypothetical protein
MFQNLRTTGFDYFKKTQKIKQFSQMSQERIDGYLSDQLLCVWKIVVID